MSKPPKDYFIFKKYIDEEKNSIGDYLYALFKIPQNLIEWVIRDLPGPVGIILRRYYYNPCSCGSFFGEFKECFNWLIGIIIIKKDNKFIVDYSSDNRILFKEYLLI